MKTIQFREALREAMSEEMRRDDRVLLLGEEVAEYNGAYKVSQGMLDEFGPKRVIDTPIAEIRDARRFAPRARNRRYATSSTSTASTAHAIIEPTRAMTIV